MTDEIDTSAKAGWRMVRHLWRRVATNGEGEQRSPVTDLIRTLANERDEWRQRAEKAEAALREILELDPAELAWGTIKAKNIAREAIRNEGGDDD